MSNQVNVEYDIALGLESICFNGEMLLAFPRGRHAEFQSRPAKVTVMVPVFNGEARLDRCLQSVAGQSFTDFQVIVVDNGSTDKSFALACRFAAQHANALVYQNPRNLGRVGNWNRCLELATGQFLKPLMVNDYLLPDCLGSLSAILDLQPDVVLVRSSVTTLDQGTTHFGPLFAESRRFTSQQALEYCITTGNPAAGPSAQMFRRLAVAERSLRFDTDYAWAADFEFAQRLVEQGSFHYLRESLFVFEITNRFATQSHLDRELRDEIAVIGSAIARNSARLSPEIVSRGRARAESLRRLYFGKCSTPEEHAACAKAWEEVCRRYPVLLEPAAIGRAGKVHLVTSHKVTGQWQQRWQSAAPHEISFWEEWCRTGGGKWPEEFQARVNPETPLQTFVTQSLDIPPGGTLDLLDVGSGPMTDLGKRWAGRTVRLTAVDPLADDYNALLRQYGIVAPVPTQSIAGEFLTAKLPLNHFDVVHARNSIDHSLDAPHVIDQMLAVLKPGGWIIMSHNISEADAASNEGLHDWNFYARGGHFIIAKYAGEAVNITERYAGIANVKCEAFADQRWLTVHMRKLVPSAFEASTEPPAAQSGPDLATILRHLEAARSEIDCAKEEIARLSAPVAPVQFNFSHAAFEPVPVAAPAPRKLAPPSAASPTAQRAEADKLFQSAQWFEAGQIYQSLTNHFPDDLELWQRLHGCALKQGHSVLASIILNDALSTHPAWKSHFTESAECPALAGAANSQN